MSRHWTWIAKILGLLLGVGLAVCIPHGECETPDKAKIKRQMGVEALEMPALEEDEGLPIHIQADSITYSRKEDRYVAEGAVEITRGNMILRADRVTLDNRTRFVTAEGNVEVVEQDGGYLQSEQLELDIEEKTGRISKGTIFFPDYSLTVYGEEIERLSEDRYRLAGAILTTCSGETPDWRFKAREIELTIEGMAKVKHATFDVRKFPVFYLPYLAYPAKTKRQTGFLLPSLRSNDHVGFGGSLPFFWAFHKSWDATFIQTYFTESGYQQGVELRYAPSESVEGALWGEYIRDQADFGDEATRGGQPRTEKDRWRFRMKQLLDLPWGVNSKSRIDIVSDNYYLDDFSWKQDERYLRYLISTINATKREGAYLLAGEVEYYRNLDAPRDDNDLTPQLLPAVLFHRAQTPILGLPLSVGWDVTFDDFWRREGSTGQVVGLAPDISLPIPLGSYFSIVPFLRWEENIFWTQDDPLADAFGHVSNYHYGISLASAELARVYPVGWKSLEGLQHALFSEFRFDGFGHLTDGVFPEEFIEPFSDETLFTFKLTQFLTGKFIDPEGNTKFREFARFELAQSYKAKGEEPAEPFLPLFMDLEMHLMKAYAGRYNLFLEIEGFYDWYESLFEDFTLTLRGADDRGDALRVVYEWDKQVKAGLDIAAVPFLDMNLDGWYDFTDDKWVRYGYGLTFYAGCWAVNFSHTIRPGFAETPTDHSFHGKIFLRGLGSVIGL